MHAKTNHTSTHVSDDISNPARVSDDKQTNQAVTCVTN